MIYLTGDTHGHMEVNRFNMARFKEQVNMTKTDYLIILGDFGLVWNNNKEELYWRSWLNEKNFTTLFIDGNHENFDILNALPVETWNGGKVHKVSNSIIHLMRGQVFSIGDVKFFTFGGCASMDKKYRILGESWWAQEIPSDDEMQEGRESLEAYDWKVDFVLTHALPASKSERYFEINEINKYQLDSTTEDYLEEIDTKLEYNHWFCGHYHVNFKLGKKYTIVYDDIIRLV